MNEFNYDTVDKLFERLESSSELRVSWNNFDILVFKPDDDVSFTNPNYAINAGDEGYLFVIQPNREGIWKIPEALRPYLD